MEGLGDGFGSNLGFSRGGFREVKLKEGRKGRSKGSQEGGNLTRPDPLWPGVGGYLYNIYTVVYKYLYKYVYKYLYKISA